MGSKIRKECGGVSYEMKRGRLVPRFVGRRHVPYTAEERAKIFRCERGLAALPPAGPRLEAKLAAGRAELIAAAAAQQQAAFAAAVEAKRKAAQMALFGARISGVLPVFAPKKSKTSTTPTPEKKPWHYYLSDEYLRSRFGLSRDEAEAGAAPKTPKAPAPTAPKTPAPTSCPRGIRYTKSPTRWSACDPGYVSTKGSGITMFGQSIYPYMPGNECVCITSKAGQAIVEAESAPKPTDLPRFGKGDLGDLMPIALLMGGALLIISLVKR